MTLFRPGTFIKSMEFALRGIKYTYTHEQNFRVHSFIASIVILLAVVLKVQVWEAIILILVITSVLVLEILNTVFEKITDLVKPRLHHYVAIIKDLMAAAVLISSFTAVIIGVLIFFPYVKDLFE